jgi:hypothetical protein
MLQDPVRLLLLAAGAAMVLGSALSWLEVWLPAVGWTEVSSFARAGDGLITLEIGVVIVGYAWSDRVAGSRLAVLVLVPLVVGMAALAILWIAFVESNAYLASLINSGGHGNYLPGFWLTAAGALGVVLGGAVHVLRTRRDVRYRFRLAASTAAGIIGGVLGGVGGILAAVIAGAGLSNNATNAGAVVTLLTIVLAIVGSWVGAQVVRSFVGPGDT